MAKSVSVKKAKAEPVNSAMHFANASVSLSAAPPASRISLRATPTGAKSFAKSLGMDLPSAPGETASKRGVNALWLGPDEWLLYRESKPEETMVPRLANENFSAVDISHRNTAFVISGEGAQNVLNAACPRDLSLTAFPKGTCSRTLFGKAEIVLHRTQNDTFRMECWRSYAPYVWAYLLDAAKDAHI